MSMFGFRYIKTIDLFEKYKEIYKRHTWFDDAIQQKSYHNMSFDFCINDELDIVIQIKYVKAIDANFNEEELEDLT